MEHEFNSDLVDQHSQFRFIPVLLFTMEVYHAIGHACVLFRLRMLPRKDLVRVKYYFLADLLSVTSCAVYTREVIWLAALQNIQHAFFFLTWNEHSYCRKIISWSSLDWLQGQSKDKLKDEQTWDAVIGTAFDLVVHIVYSYILWCQLVSLEYISSFVLVAVMTRVVLFNSRFAWSNPDGVPTWVSRRIGPLPQTQK